MSHGVNGNYTHPRLGQSEGPTGWGSWPSGAVSKTPAAPPHGYNQRRSGASHPSAKESHAQQHKSRKCLLQKRLGSRTSALSVCRYSDTSTQMNERSENHCIKAY